MHKLAAALVALLAAGPHVQGASIDVGDHRLLANTPGQVVEIRVAGGDAVEGLNFRVQVADGGTHPQAGGVVDGPRIAAVDLITDTIFAGNTTGQEDLLRLPQIWVQTTTSAAGSVPADGLLARLTLDTTGFFEGTFGLSLGDTQDGPTDFAGVPIDISDGSITVVVPEPGSWALCVAGVVGLIVTRRRRVKLV